MKIACPCKDIKNLSVIDVLGMPQSGIADKKMLAAATLI